MRRFTGTDTYVVTSDLQVSVNAAIALERPLLVKGEPGTGKTILAHEIARGISRDLITWHIKSTTKAQQGLYEYDAVSRLRDGQLGDERVHDIANYIVPGKPSFPTICCSSSIGWSSTSTKRGAPFRLGIARS